MKDIDAHVGEMKEGRRLNENPNNAAGLLALADHMMETGIPGANIVRAAGYHVQRMNHGRVFPLVPDSNVQFGPDSYESMAVDDDPEAAPYPGARSQFPNIVSGGFIPPEDRPLDVLGNPPPAYVKRALSPKTHSQTRLHVYVPVYSRRQLRHLLSDVLPHQRKAIWDHITQGLPPEDLPPRHPTDKDVVKMSRKSDAHDRVIDDAVQRAKAAPLTPAHAAAYGQHLGDPAHGPDFVKAVHALAGRTSSTVVSPKFFGAHPVTRRLQARLIAAGHSVTPVGTGSVAVVKRVRLARPDEATHSGLIRAIADAPAETTPRLAFADHLEEAGVPGSAVVRGHVARMEAGGTGRNTLPRQLWNGAPVAAGRILLLGPTQTPVEDTSHFNSPEALAGSHPYAQIAYPVSAVRLRMGANALTLAARPRVPGSGIAVMVHHRAAAETGRPAVGVGHWVHVPDMATFARVTADFPPWARKAILRQAGRALAPGPARLARVNGTGAAVRQAGTGNTDTRVGLFRQVLSEAGLGPAAVREALSHGPQGLRQSVLAAVRNAHSAEHARYAAAWAGLLSGEPRLTAFVPGEGGDALHVIDTAAPADHVAQYLSRAGLTAFAVERRGAGSRAYVVNPGAATDINPIARGLDGRNTTLRGSASRLGADSGSDADSRAGYRSVIRDFERSVGVGGTPGTDTGPASGG